jgi:hypothetical protein
MMVKNRILYMLAMFVLLLVSFSLLSVAQGTILDKFEISVAVDDANFITPGSEVNAVILIYDLETQEDLDILLRYSIKDGYDSELNYAEESFVVKEQKKVVAKLSLKEDLVPGTYFFDVVASSGDYKTISHVPFEVSDVSKLDEIAELPGKRTYLGLIQVLFVALIVMVSAILVVLFSFGFFGPAQSLDGVSNYLKFAEKAIKEKDLKNASKYYTKARDNLLSAPQGSVISNPELVRKVLEFDISRLKGSLTRKKVLGRTNRFKIQLKDWKKKGYDTSVIEESIRQSGKKISKLSKSQLSGEKKALSAKINDWKKKGYAVEVLVKRLEDIDANGSKKKLSASEVRKEIGKLEASIKKWKTKGYDTVLLDKRLKILRKSK